MMTMRAASAKVNGDIITQNELRAVWDLFFTKERLADSIAKRVDAGAKVERGSLVIGFLEGDHGNRPTIGNNITGFMTTSMEITKRKHAIWVMGKPVKRRNAQPIPQPRAS
jgi:hypothetical protein